MAKFTSQPPYVPTPSLLTDALGCRLLYSIVPFVRPSKDDYLFLVSFQETYHYGHHPVRSGDVHRPFAPCYR